MPFQIILPYAQLDLNHPDKYEPLIENFDLKQLYHHRKSIYRDCDLPTLQTATLMILNIPPVLYKNQAVNIGALLSKKIQNSFCFQHMESEFMPV